MPFLRISGGNIYQASNVPNSISYGMSHEAADEYYGGSNVYTSASPSSGLQVAVVAGLAVVGVGLLIFFIVLCCVCYKHKSVGRILRGAAQPSSGPALYPVPPGPAVKPLDVFYSKGQHAVAPDQPPAYDGERRRLSDF